MKLHVILPYAATLLLGSLPAQSQEPPFGTDSHKQFGDSLWQALEERNFVGEDAIMAKPYEGTEPHGSILVTLESEIEVDGQQGAVLVKRNYGGEGASMEAVSNNPRQYLMATTVMFQREGFDPEHNDWFWAKYMPDGSYDAAPDGRELVGAAPGCISCHSEAEQGMVYLNNRYGQ